MTADPPATDDLRIERWQTRPAALLRAARFRHPGHLVLILRGIRGHDEYVAFGPHARIVRHVVYGEPLKRRYRDYCLVNYESIGPALRTLLTAGYKVAIYEAEQKADSLDRVALQEFPARVWLEPDADYLTRVTQWVEDYRRPALAFRPEKV